MVLDASATRSITGHDENGDSNDEDEDSADEDSSDEDDLLSANLNSDGKPSGKLGRQLQISHLLKMVLQDAQTRLVFKAQSVIQSDIRHFVPKAEDLAYPDVLVGVLFLMLVKKRDKKMTDYFLISYK